MAKTVATQIRIDIDVKKQATSLFKDLGMDMSSAVNIFLRQCILNNGLPFSVELPKYNLETLVAMEEAKSISRDPNVKGYTNLDELFSDLEQD